MPREAAEAPKRHPRWWTAERAATELEKRVHSGVIEIETKGEEGV
jgi:hypothetical protein